MSSCKILTRANLRVPFRKFTQDNFKRKRSSNAFTLSTEMREQFSRLTGGRVTLKRNEETGIAYIALDHAGKKNGISGKMMVDLNDVVSELENWKTGKGLILYGTCGTFCSGGYLDTVKNICNSEDGYKMASLMHDSMIRLRNLPLVSVALVSGKAVGGGAELMLWPDFRLMTPSAEIRFVEARMGVGTGWAGGTLLQRLVGHRVALDLLLTCRKVSSDEALVLGLADDLLEEGNDENANDDFVLKKASEWLQQRIGALHYTVVQTVKGIVACDNLEEERRIFANTWGGIAQQHALNKNLKHN